MKDIRFNVGPVLMVGELTDHLIAVIRKTNKSVSVEEHGSYVRVSVPYRCSVTKAAVEEEFGNSFVFPDDLELVMPSFRGVFTVSSQEALWISAEGQRSTLNE